LPPAACVGAIGVRLRADRNLLLAGSIMDILLQVFIVTTSVCVVGLMIRRAGRKSESIEAGAVSTGWLAEYRVRRKDFSG
jgi:hypothetical protein